MAVVVGCHSFSSLAARLVNNNTRLTTTDGLSIHSFTRSVALSARWCDVRCANWEKLTSYSFRSCRSTTTDYLSIDIKRAETEIVAWRRDLSSNCDRQFRLLYRFVSIEYQCFVLLTSTNDWTVWRYDQTAGGKRRRVLLTTVLLYIDTVVPPPLRLTTSVHDSVVDRSCARIRWLDYVIASDSFVVFGKSVLLVIKSSVSQPA